MIWKSEVDYIDEAKTQAFNGQIEFVPESLLSLSLEKYFTEYPELEKLCKEEKLDYQSPNLQKAYDFIENDLYLSDQVYDDWIKNTAESLEENCAVDLVRSNRENLDTLLNEADLNKTSLIGCYEGHLFYVPEVSADTLLDEDNGMEFIDLNGHSLSIKVTSFEFAEFRPSEVKICGFDNHERVEISLYTGRDLLNELEDNQDIKKLLEAYVKNCSDLNQGILNYDYDSFLLKDLKEMELEKARNNSNRR